MKILFICRGNVSRSQMAEAYYNHFTKSNDAASAGILDFTSLKYGHPAEEVIKVMKEDGIDISKQIVKFITEEMVNKADRIFVMCERKECPEFLLNSNKITFWDINDPYDTSLENHRRIRNEVKKHVKQLIKNSENEGVKPEEPKVETDPTEMGKIK
jgi:arsenate reductase